MNGTFWALNFASFGLLLPAFVLSCAGPRHGANNVPTVPSDTECRAMSFSGLRINELMGDNEGAALDQAAETEDYVELFNTGPDSVNLGCVSLSRGGSTADALPPLELEPQQVAIFWADEQPDQGNDHLAFKVPAAGGRILLRDRDGVLLDEVDYPRLEENVSFARFPDGQSWISCRYSSAGRINGATCSPKPPKPRQSQTFTAYEIPRDFLEPAGPLSVEEIDIGSEGFVELMNRGNNPVELQKYTLEISAHGPGLPWPEKGDGISIPLVGELGALQRGVVRLDASQILEITEQPLQEAVLSLFDEGGEVQDRVDFMRWPEGAVLARTKANTFSYCRDRTPGKENSCVIWPERDVGDRVRYLRTEGDFAALSQGATELGIRPVKFVVDLASGGVGHLLSSAHWALHYTFVREQIYGEPSLNRCDEAEAKLFYDGWVDFSAREYFKTADRSFFLSTLSHHAGPDLMAVEYAFGDVISGQQMRDAFYWSIAHVDVPQRWVLRVQDQSQSERARAVEGELPIVGPNSAFEDLDFQALNQGTAFGELRFVEAAQLPSEPLGPKVILITDDVPNDIPLVGGLITEALQTPLAHVNVLSQSRGTPNAALRDARLHPLIAPLLGHLVKLEIHAGGFTVSEADPAEAETHWATFKQGGAKVSPRIDRSVRGLQDLRQHSLDSIPAIGAKASQLSELVKISEAKLHCGEVAFPAVAEKPFAIPLVHYLEHFEDSGAEELLMALEATQEFIDDPLARAAGLLKVRRAIMDHPVDAELLLALEAEIKQRFGNRRVRLRSSSNTEDLQDFNGAGLYTSQSAELDDPERTVEDALTVVWASLWNTRAYDERSLANIDQGQVAMAVLIHPAFLSEEANGVAVSRNVLDPTRGDVYYIGAQRGEASVTNPAPGVTTEQLTYAWNARPPRVEQLASSSLLSSEQTQVLDSDELAQLACGLRHVHRWFSQRLDPTGEQRRFAMEVEYKLADESRELVFKQARPHPFPAPGVDSDCREL